ncbi:SAV0927 family protein [Halobacillus seohaensis]|uniref:SAV0927 family protein n=1 Tax=Halobacillus seohaensis TaxID=447421 RepID=A0ABW2ESN5_9BACI
MSKLKVLSDSEEQTNTRFISFTVGSRRYEFAFMKANYFDQDTLVIDLMGNRNYLLNHDTLERKGHIEHVFHMNEMEADQLRDCFQSFL